MSTDSLHTLVANESSVILIFVSNFEPAFFFKLVGGQSLYNIVVVLVIH